MEWKLLIAVIGFLVVVGFLIASLMDYRDLKKEYRKEQKKTDHWVDLFKQALDRIEYPEKYTFRNLSQQGSQC